MSILGTLRTGATPSPYPYVDTPDFDYAQWLDGLGTSPIGSISNGPKIAVVGGGGSGLCAAYELARAGCNVDLFEATDQWGGRCDSYYFSGSTDLIELGAMRFPPSEFLLNYYLESLSIVPGGISSLDDFADPGINETFISYQSDVQTWLKKTAQHPQGTDYPTGFGTVYTGWIALNDNGVTSNNGATQVLDSVNTIQGYLQAGSVTDATSAWQKWVDFYGQRSFYSVLYELFTGSSGYDIPGDTAWSFDDFTRFGALGIGSGGFGPLYNVGFTEILRLVINGLETTQKAFPLGIRTLPETFKSQLEAMTGVTINFHASTPIEFIFGFKGAIAVQDINGTKFTPYDRVIVAMTTRAMELGTNVTNFSVYLTNDVCEAAKRTHVVPSNKVAARINKFWANDSSIQRTLLTDTMVKQVYTLDYGEANTGICFITYTWEDDATKQQALGLSDVGSAIDKETLYKALLRDLQLSNGADVSQWSDNLVPLNGDYSTNVQFIEWQSAPYFNGAFKLARPGQDVFVQEMFYDYQKVNSANTTDDQGVYIAGDCIDWNAGWVEGGLRTALNAASAVIKSVGGAVSGGTYGKTPLDIDATRFNYFS